MDELFEVLTVKAAFLSWGDVQVELRQLSEPLTPQEAVGGLYGRLDHIAIELKDIDETFAALRSKGIETRQEAPQRVSRFLTFHTRPPNSCDVLFQFVQRAPG